MRTMTKSILMLWTLLLGTPAFADGGGGGGVGGGCRLPVGNFFLMFSAYQPQVTGNVKYCTTLPNLGHTNLVFDYETLEGTTAQKSKLNLDRQIKQMMIEVEVVKDGQTIYERPAESMEKGTIESVVDFKEAGEYEVHVTLTDPNGKSIENHMALQVGKDTGETTRNAIIAAVIIFAVLYFVYLSSAGFRKQVDALIAKFKKF